MEEIQTTSDVQTETTQENLPEAALPTEASSAADGKTFEELIKGPYKEEYEKRIQRILQRRLRSSRETEAKYADLLGTLAKKYGVDAGDPEAVRSAVAAEQPGSAPEVHTRAAALYNTWLRQAEEAKSLYPGLDLAAEAANPAFTSRLRQGLSVEDAYFLAHKDEILVSAMTSAARDAEEKLSSALASGGLRPRENGAAAQGAATTRVDAAHMTKAQRQAYIRRVQKGETIRL